MKTIILFFTILLFNGCECLYMDHIETIILDNNSGNRLYYHVGYNSSPIIYPNTSLPLNENDLILSSITTNVFFGNSTKWEDRIKELPLDTLSIYFFHPNTLSTYSWEEIRTDYKILKRYDLSIQDLELLNFKVSYPPTSEMADIKQYPPF